MSFLTNLQNAISGYRAGDPRYKAGSHHIRVRVRDLEELIEHFTRLDNVARDEHHMADGCDHLLMIEGGPYAHRQEAIGALSLQLVLAGFRLDEAPPLTTGSRTYIGFHRLTGTKGKE